MRKEVGEQVDLQYDANNGLSVSTAIRLGRRFQDELNVIHNPEKSKLLWGIFKKSYEPQNGYMLVPDGPGLELELDEAAMKRL